LLVDGGLDGRVTNGTDGGEHETCGDAGDRTKMDATSAKEGVEDMVQEGNEYDDGEWVEIVEDIVGNTVGNESRRLEVRCCTKTSVVDVGNGVEEENPKQE